MRMLDLRDLEARPIISSAKEIIIRPIISRVKEIYQLK